MPSTKVPSVVVSVGGGAIPLVSGGGSDAALAAHIADPVGAHAASAISTIAGPLWADGTTNPKADAQIQLDKIISDITSAAGSGGAGKVYKLASGNWYDGSSIAAGDLNSWLNTTISDLASTAALDDGAGRIGWSGGLDWADSTTNPVTSVRLQLEKIIADLTSVAGKRGAGKLTKGVSPAWADTTTISAADLSVWLDQVVSDLASGAAGSSGAGRIGVETAAGAPWSLTQPTAVRQLSELLGAVNAPFRVRTVLASDLTIDSGGVRDSIVLVNTTMAARTLTLPDPTVNSGRMLVVVDSGGNSEMNTITLARHAAEQINGLAADLVLRAAWGQWRVVCSGTNWFVA